VLCVVMSCSSRVPVRPFRAGSFCERYSRQTTCAVTLARVRACQSWTHIAPTYDTPKMAGEPKRVQPSRAKAELATDEG